MGREILKFPSDPRSIDPREIYFSRKINTGKILTEIYIYAGVVRSGEGEDWRREEDIREEGDNS